jgi:transposase
MIMGKAKIAKAIIDLVRPNAAGIDIASEVHYVSVPNDRDSQSVRKFGSFTEDLHKMAQWLKQCNIDTVAMESTGIYWVQPYLILEEYGFEVYLVNARHIKNVSGRKSDVQDCQWIRQLHSYGLLNRSFQPESLTRELRAYMRHRKHLVESTANQILHMQKAFEQMNIKLHDVISDITGQSGMLMIKAILEGERDANTLAQLANGRIKATQEQIVKSLTAVWREEHLFELKQAFDLYQYLNLKIIECDAQITNVLTRLVGNNSSDDIKRHKRRHKNSFHFDGTKYLKQILGIDVTRIYGISEITATEIISEVGTDMSKWSTEKHFVSWLNLAPNNRITGGKMLKPKKTNKRNKAGQAFMMAASTLKNSDHWLGAFYRRIRARRGTGIAVKATARKISLIFYKMLKDKIEFDPLSIDTYNQYFKEHRIKSIEKQAHALGLKLVPTFVS